MATPPPPNPTDTWWSASGGSTSAALLAGRYRLEALIGRGGGGDVHRAWDQLEERDVAVKLFRGVGGTSDARVRREVGALRLLDIPGVVRILDDGDHEGAPYLVTELVEGAPFPGQGRRTWATIQAPTLSLLRALDAVHAAGVVHRDIKPQNVLVTADGQSVLLDFGLARGAPVGATITAAGAVLGTPRYLAPEQLLGERVGPRADLYALGVMLYEALAGRPPHQGSDFEALWHDKLHAVPVPLDRLVESLPPGLATVVEQLLAVHAADRPVSALAVLDALGSGPGAGLQLPWLGGRVAVDAVVAAGRARRPLDVVGPRRSGRTTTLREAGRVLRDLGASVAWTLPGHSPFESLSPVIGPAAELAEASDVRAAAHDQLAGWLAAGGVLLVDGREQLDRWSLKLVDQVEGAVLAAGSGPREGRAAVVLEPLAEADLLPLFHGPERLLHLPSDGARELYRRSHGYPGAVVAELGAWVLAGLGAWEEGRLRLDRAAVDRLRAGLRTRQGDAVPGRPSALEPGQRELLAWIQLAGRHATAALLAEVVARPRWQVDLELADLVAVGVVRSEQGGAQLVGLDHDLAATWPGAQRLANHATLARALPSGSEGRLFHLMAGGVPELVAAEALTVARQQRNAGRVGEAEATLREAMRALRREGDVDGEAQLLAPLVRTAVAANAVRALERVAYELGRALRPVPALQQLCEAALAARRGEHDHALQLCHALGRQADPEAELARLHICMLASQSRPELVEAVVDELRSLSLQSGDQELGGLVPGWEGLLRYRQGRYTEAARLHEESAARRSHELGRLSSRVNAAMAWLEAGQFERATEVARVVLDMAHAVRAPAYEAQGEWVLRSVRASRRDGSAPDLELVEAAAAMGDQSRLAVVCCTEAVIAWHAGMPAVGADLARKAAAASLAHGSALGVLFAEGIVALCDVGWEGDGDALAGRAVGCGMPTLGLDMLGMLALGGRLRGDWTAAAERLIAAGGAVDLMLARGMLSPAEALAQVRAAAARGG